MSPQKVAEALERQKVLGWIDTSFHDVHRKIRMLASGDQGALFGLGHLLPTTIEEVVAGLNELSGWDYNDQEGSRGKSYIDPSVTAKHIERVADRLHDAVVKGERVFFGTGHPTGPLEMYARLSTAMRDRGADIVRVSEGDSFDGYVGGSQLRYVCDVACASMGGDLIHTHSPRAMEFLLKNGLKADLVVGDHGFTGAALAQGMEAIAIVDTNDPALVLAWARELPVWPILCDDNRPAACYDTLTRFLIDRL